MNFRALRFALVAFGSTLLLSAPLLSAARPALVLKDASGERVRLSDYRGHVMVLNFWATWCGPCRNEMTMLVEMEKLYSGRGVVFVGASLDDARTSRQIPDFLAGCGVKYPIWYGATADDVARFGLGSAIPDTLILDEEGQIVARVLGDMRRRELEERLNWVLGDRTGPSPQAFVRHVR
jgi:thiol-disulfide isomerase/thioredoxin